MAARRPGPGGMNVRHVLHAPLLGQEHLLQVWGSTVLWGGDNSQGGQGGGQGKGGVYQGGVATRMGGLRILGPNGLDQTHTPQEAIPRTERGHLGFAGLKVEARRFVGRGLEAWAPQRVRRRRWDPAVR